MARKDEMEGLGVTFKIGPGKKLIKRDMDAKLEVSGGKPKARPPVAGPKPVAKPTPSGIKPVESQSNMPRGGASKPTMKPVESQSKMPRGPATPNRQISKTPVPGGKSFIESFVAPSDETSTARVIKINPEALTGGTKKSDGSYYGDTTSEDRAPQYRGGGKVRGDGKCRCTTKGRMV